MDNHNHDAPAVQAVGAIVFRNGKAGGYDLLLIKKRGGDWTFPKGHIEPDEADHAALERELREETGVTGEPLALVQAVTYPVFKRGSYRHKTVTYYLVRFAGGKRRPATAEGIRKVEWVPLARALKRLRNPRVRAIGDAAAEHLQALTAEVGGPAAPEE